MHGLDARLAPSIAGANRGRCRRLISDVVAADDLVGQRSQRRTEQWPNDVDPEVVPLPAARAGPNERAGFIDAPVTGPAEQSIETDRPADRDRGRGADRASVGGDGHDHEHQDRREDQLVDECAAGSRRDGTVAPRWAGLSVQTARRARAPAVAPASWAPT